MKKFFVFLFFFFFTATQVQAASLGKKFAGQFIVNTDKNNETWFVNNTDCKRYPARTFTEIQELISKFATPIPELDFQKIVQAEMPVAGDKAVAKKYAGKIVLRVANQEAWYVSQNNFKRYGLRTVTEASGTMTQAAQKVSGEDLAKIHKPGITETVNQYSSFAIKNIKTPSGNFKINVVEIDLANPNLKIITDTANNETCKANCSAKSLAKYALTNKAFAAINGSYFCSNEGCNNKNYYFFPVYNSRVQSMINDDQLKYWTTGPILAFDANNKFHYFKDSREFKSVDNFQQQCSAKIQAAIGNKPRLIENGMNLLFDWALDDKQMRTKAVRNAFGYKNTANGYGKIYLVVANNATVPDLAEIMQALGVDDAINLDGGYSAALYYNDEYMVGPGRDIPNAIVFAEN